MQILLTIFVLSVATTSVCWAYDMVYPYDETHANIGAVAVPTAFLSGLLALLVFIWS